MRLRIFPDDSAALTSLAQLADQVQEAVRCCSELLAAEDDRVEELMGQARAIGSRTADLHFGVMTTARTSFVLPLPRTDLYLLSAHLARAAEELLIAIDALAESPDRRRQDEGLTDQLAAVARMAALSRQAMLDLTTLDGLDEYWFDMHRLRRQSQRTHQRRRLQVFDHQQPAEAMRDLLVIDQLYAAARAMSALAHEVGRITVSEA